MEGILPEKFDQQQKEIAITVPRQIVGLLLVEIARSRGLYAWLDPEMAGIVWVRGTESEVERLLALAEPARCRR